MTAQPESNRTSPLILSVLPWLVAGGMLIAYGFTLDHWVSPESLRHITDLTGLTWLKELSGPVFFLVTYPIRWLPPATVPVAANFFTAVCAALTLALLARSVMLLPHDRTQEERQRNPNRQAFLTISNAWLPPILAALACGFQLTFWQHAIATTSEMLELLLFAYLVRCLLEFRISQKESWLWRFALVDGMATANNWAMVAFLPAFLLALCWITGLFNFFSPAFVARFLKEKRFSLRLPFRLVALWLAGASLLFLLPLQSALSQTNHINFWTALGFTLRNEYLLLKVFPLRTAFFLSLTSLWPVLFMGIRWGRLVADASPRAVLAMTTFFHGIHAFFLGVCVWGVMDPPFSPRHVQPAFPCLPLYFLMALSIGYYSGYFLLVFSQRNEKSRRKSHPALPYVNLASVGAIWILLLALPAILIARNLPGVVKSSAVADYFDQMQKALPPRGAIILSEDTTRLQFLEASLIRSGRQADYVLLDAALLAHFPGYFQFVEAHHPDFKLSQGFAGEISSITNPAVLIHWVRETSRSHEIYFMHPCLGYFGEIFSAQPHPLCYQMNLRATETLFTPAVSPALVAENQEFWQTFRESKLPGLLQRIQPPPPPAHPNLWQRFQKAAHLRAEPDLTATLAGYYYSVMLNSWGVDLQRLGNLTDATVCFEQARQLNPENAAAQLNLQCNRDLLAHKVPPFDPAQHVEEKLGRSRDWDQSVRLDGLTDEPNACYRLGLRCAEARMARQAIQQFLRVQAMVPDAPEAPMRLAELFVKLGDFTNSLAETDIILRHDPQNPRGLILRSINLVELRRFYDAIPPLNEVLQAQPANTDARLARGLAYLTIGKLLAAQDDYDQVVRARPNAYPAYYGLAAIAHEKKDTPALIKNCELYLTNAPMRAPEMEQVRKWLHESKP